MSSLTRIQYVVKVPPGKYPGDTVSVTYGGQDYTVCVPSGKYPGDTFNVSTPAPRPSPPRKAVAKQIQYVVKVPSGKWPGDTITVTHGGKDYTVTVPSGKMPGDTFNVERPADAASTRQTAERCTFADWLRRDPFWGEVKFWAQAGKELERNGYKLSDWYNTRVTKRTFDRVVLGIGLNPKKCTAAPPPPSTKQPFPVKTGAAGKRMFRRATMEPMDRLKQAKSMLEAGLITQADYVAVKKKALGI